MKTNGAYKIPNIIHYTFFTSNLPKEIAMVVNHNKNMCKGCEFVFYNDDDCDNFIKLNFDAQTHDAYKSINDAYGAMKADFFRYCVLYKIGGIYIDVKSKINIPIFKLIKKDDTCLLDMPKTALERWRKHTYPTFEQWLLIFAPGHPYLHGMIHLMMHYIKTKYEPTIPHIPKLTTKEKILHVTGPDAFAKAIRDCINSNSDANGANSANNYASHRHIEYSKYFQRTCSKTDNS